MYFSSNLPYIFLGVRIHKITGEDANDCIVRNMRLGLNHKLKFWWTISWSP